MKWQRQYEGPYLVVATPTPLTVKIQRNAKAQAKVVHVDKLKKYLGTPPRSWLPDQTTGDLSPLSTPTTDQTDTEPQKLDDDQPVTPLRCSPDRRHLMHSPLATENFNQTDGTSVPLSDIIDELDIVEQMGMKQKIDTSSSNESPFSSEPVATNCEVLGGQRDRARQNLVRSDARNGRPRRARRTPARYRDFRMEGSIGGQQGKNEAFQTGPKSVGAVHFPPALTCTSPRKQVTPRLSVINNSGVSRRSSGPVIVLVGPGSNLRIDELVRMNF